MKPTALYRHYDKDDNLLYIGVSISSIGRYQSHRSQSHWAKDITTMTTEWFDSERLALRAEKKAIKSEKPIYNIVHNLDNPDRKECIPCSEKEDFENVQLLDFYTTRTNDVRFCTINELILLDLIYQSEKLKSETGENYHLLNFKELGCNVNIVKLLESIQSRVYYSKLTFQRIDFETVPVIKKFSFDGSLYTIYTCKDFNLKLNFIKGYLKPSNKLRIYGDPDPKYLNALILNYECNIGKMLKVLLDKTIKIYYGMESYDHFYSFFSSKFDCINISEEDIKLLYEESLESCDYHGITHTIVDSSEYLSEYKFF